MTTLRAELASFINLVKNGDEVIITERGTPVARLTGIKSSSVIDRLTADGYISKPTGQPRIDARAIKRIVPTPGPPISEMIAEMRNGRDY